MKRIFLTHIVPKDKILEYNLSVAACNFSHTLIDGQAFDEVYSILPTFVCKKIAPFKGLVRSSLRNVPVLNKLAPIWENICLFFQIPRKSSVWYYNCTILNATLIVLLKLFKPSVRQNMILLDYTPSTKLLDRFYLRLSNKMSGTICLANSSLFTCRNSECLPGVVPLSTANYPRVESFSKHFLISGALGDNIAMLPLLLETFSQLPDMTLHITGKAPNPVLVRRYTDRCDNIIYHGIVPYDDYLYLLHSVPFLLSTRNPEAPENQCNFPSKIIEALLHNRVVISTLHYEQLKGIRCVEVPSDPQAFKDALQRIGAMPLQTLMEYANQSEAVKRRFGVEVWKKTMEQIEKR